MPHSVHSTPGSSTPNSGPIPFWNVNVVEDQWTIECPEWLLKVDARDQKILATRESDYKSQSWGRILEIINTNRLDLFERRPADLRRYLHYIYDLKKSYGSVLSFIQHERLHWGSVTPSPDPHFTNSNDYKVLQNDWPYGIDREISHLVVWTKFSIDEDPITGDLTDAARAEIEAYIVKNFCSDGGILRDQLVWFKNWTSLKSVHAIEHFHVMLYKAPKDFIDRVTDSDQATSEQLEV